MQKHMSKNSNGKWQERLLRSHSINKMEEEEGCHLLSKIDLGQLTGRAEVSIKEVRRWDNVTLTVSHSWFVHLILDFSFKGD